MYNPRQSHSRVRPGKSPGTVIDTAVLRSHFVNPVVAVALGWAVAGEAVGGRIGVMLLGLSRGRAPGRRTAA